MAFIMVFFSRLRDDEGQSIQTNMLFNAAMMEVFWLYPRKWWPQATKRKTEREKEKETEEEEIEDGSHYYA